LANELRDAEERLAKSAYLRTLDRVIDSLYFLTTNFPYYNWTYREIAEYAGCETETAIRIAKELKQNGLFNNVLPNNKSK
ncbi:Crp/Fnr family transcriptional regulator, partial [Tessaracoccus sp. OH4464_COT-324]